MKTSIKAILVSSTLALFATTRAHCAQILINGNLEAFSGGNPTSWNYLRGEGPASLESTVNASPFTNVYPSSTRSALFTDGNSANASPQLSQSFSPQTGNLQFSFEFRLSSLAGDPWLWLLGDSETAFLTNLRLGGSGGNFTLADNTGISDVVSLSAGVWYQASMTFNLPASTYSGSITPFGGDATTWTNRSLLQNSNLASITFEDAVFTGTTNGSVAIDNVSVQTVPEPSAVVFGGLSIVYAASRRVRLNYSIVNAEHNGFSLF